MPTELEPRELDDAEDACEHLIGHGALHERETRHVDERVADADDSEEDDCGSRARPKP